MSKIKSPRLVELCQMRMPQGRVLLRSIFECLPQPQIDLMIDNFKGLWVYFPTQVAFFDLELICSVNNQIAQDWSNCAKWGCIKAECCYSKLWNAFLNSKLSSWYLIGKLIVSCYHLDHQSSHLANWARRKFDFPEVAPEVHQFSQGNCIFDISS